MASPDEALAKMVGHLPEKTGKSLPQWLSIISSSGLQKHGEIMKLLKGSYGVTHGYANLIALTALRSAGDSSDETDLVDAQYSGGKAAMRAIYEALLAAVQKFGGDVEIAPKKAYVSLRRRKQFAIIQPSTATRIDVGINVKGVEATGRLEKSGSFNSMVSHRVRIGSVKEADKELIAWLKQAYEQA